MTNVNDRDIVVPGQLLGEKIRCEGLCLTEGDRSYALVKGLARVRGESASVIPLSGAYVPKAGDVILGVVEQDFGGVYLIGLDCPYKCILRPSSGRHQGRGRDRGRGRGDSRYSREEESYSVGDILSAKIVSVDEVKEAQLIGPRKLGVGYVIKITPVRVPRVIGKKKSMITLIRDYSGSRIVVGQNGLIWLSGGDISLAVEAIRKVEAEAHTSGLTDRITQYLKSRSKKKSD